MKKILIGILIFIVFSIALYQYFKVSPIIVGKKPNITQRAFILLHGYGAARNDLENVANLILKEDPRWSCILIPGPYSAGFSGYCYYSVRGGKTKQDYLQKYAKDRAKTRAIIDGHVAELIAQGVPIDKIVIGGFSEGAIVAMDYILDAPEKHKLSGLVFLSGRVEHLSLGALGKRKKPINAFISHGIDDNVVSIHESKRLVKVLSKNKKNKITTSFFDGEHQIHRGSLKKLGEYLKKIR